MATGSPDDLAARLERFAPSRWFPSGRGSRIQATFSGFSAALSINYGQMAYALLQSRIQTATDAFLDLAASSWLGVFPRRLNEPDVDFSKRVLAEIIRPRNTRAAITRVLHDLTGNLPTVFRPSYVADTGAYGFNMAYGVAGAWGSYTAPFQALVSVQRGTAAGSGAIVAYPGPLGGYGTPPGGYGVGSSQYGDGAPAQGAVTNADIYAAVASVTPAGHINWVAISNPPGDTTPIVETPPAGVWDQGVWDQAIWAP